MFVSEIFLLQYNGGELKLLAMLKALKKFSGTS